MKGYLMVIVFVFGLDISMMSQTDGFFYSSRFRTLGNNDRYETVLLPKQHGLDYNYYADNVSLGSGCLLMLGMGLVYVQYKKQNRDLGR